MNTAYQHITIDPKVCGGTPCINGRRIRVYDIAVEYELEGLSVEEICAMHPGLTLAEAHAALTYFNDHRDTFLAEFAAEDDFDRAIAGTADKLAGLAAQALDEHRAGLTQELDPDQI